MKKRIGFISFRLAGTDGVSLETAKWAEVLEEQGILRRTHGGAVYTKDSSVHSMAFNERKTTAVDEKKAIARAVAELVTAEQTVAINGGTTCFEVAKAIQGRRLSVITNSVPIEISPDVSSI